MITGATRGTGLGGALARHLLKAENEPSVIPARGLGGLTLPEQLRELVAQSAGGRTDRPVYHVFCSPDPGVADNAAARSRFWSLFEREFEMAGQPYASVEHRKYGRVHEHRVYNVVRPSGSVVNLSWDFARREKCARIVEFEHGMDAVPSKHARTIANRLRRDGRSDVADWLVASGVTEAPRPVAALTPRERLIEERSGTPLDDLRRQALAAWREGGDGAAFVAALSIRGLDLRQGRAGPVIVDAGGTAHLATRVIGAAARRFEGDRILAATVKARLEGLNLKGEETRGHDRHRTAPGRTGTIAARDPDGTGSAGGRDIGLRRLGGDLVRSDGGGVGGDGRRQVFALGGLRATAPGHGILIRRQLNGLGRALARNSAAIERARRAAERIEAQASAKRARAWALWGMTDIWGLPLT